MSTRTIAISDENCVERPGPGLAPTAFRMWRAGENPDDGGVSYFTPRSAEKLMAEQEARGRVYAFDFNHLSIVGGAGDVRSAGAAGWHELEVRTDSDGNPEMWCVNIEWCADAKEGLEADPPHWRFFSPAFDLDPYGEIVSYTNCALCINPLTHGLPALAAHTVRRIAAASKGTLPMDLKAALAVIDALLEKLDGEAKEQLQLLRDFISSMIEASEGSTEDSSSEGEGDPELASAGGEEDEDKLKAKRAASSGGDDELRSVLASALARIEELEKGTKGDRMQRLLAKHPTLSATSKKLLSALPIAAAEKLIEEMAKKPVPTMAKRNASPAVGGQTGAGGPKSPPTAVESAVDKALGLRPENLSPSGFSFDPTTNTHVFNALTPREARRLAAAKEKS